MGNPVRGEILVDGCVGSARFSGQFLENGRWIWVNLCFEERHDSNYMGENVFPKYKKHQKAMNFGKGRLFKCMKFTLCPRDLDFSH